MKETFETLPPEAAVITRRHCGHLGIHNKKSFPEWLAGNGYEGAVPSKGCLSALQVASSKDEILTILEKEMETASAEGRTFPV